MSNNMDCVVKPIYRIGVITFVIGVELPVCCAILYPTYVIGSAAFVVSIPCDYIINGNTEYTMKKTYEATNFIDRSLLRKVIDFNKQIF